MIRYQSLSMPVMVLSESYVNEEEKINVECDDEKNIDTASNNIGSDNCLKEERYIHIYFIITKYKNMHKKEIRIQLFFFLIKISN